MEAGGEAQPLGVSPLQGVAKPPISPHGREDAGAGEMGGCVCVCVMLWDMAMGPWMGKAPAAGRAASGLREGCGGTEDAFCHPPFTKVPGTALVLASCTEKHRSSF